MCIHALTCIDTVNHVLGKRVKLYCLSGAGEGRALVVPRVLRIELPVSHSRIY